MPSPHLDTGSVHSRHRNLEVAVLLTLIVSAGAWTTPNRKGRLQPMDEFVQANRPFRFTCLINHALNVDEIYFTLDNVMVPEMYVNRTGSHRAQLHHPGLAMRPLGVTLCCCARRSWQNDTRIKCHLFDIDEPPHPSLNISARIDNWNHLYLNFTKKANKMRTSVYVFCIFDGNWSDYSRDVAVYNGEYRVQISQDLTFYRQLSIRVEAKNRFGSIVNQAHYAVDNIVVPNGVTGLRALKSGHGCALELRWISPKGGQLIRYIITHRCQWETQAKGMEITSSESVIHTILENLRPYCSYTVEVMACGPSYMASCSSPCSVEAQSPPAVPGQLPQVTAGSYFLRETDSHVPCHMRHVTVFWKQVPLKYHNAPLAGYDVILFLNNRTNITTRVGPDEYSLLAGDTGACYHSYAVDIRNSLGRNSSLAPKPIKLHQEQEDFFDTDSFKAISDGGSLVNVTWSTEQLQHPNITALTVYWCLGSYLETRCRGPLDWRHCSPRRGHCNADLPSLSFQYIFAVSIDTGTGSTGMRWLSCTYQRDMAPKAPVSRVAFVGANHILLQWFSQPSDIAQGYPRTTIIRWTTEDSDTYIGESRYAHNIHYALVDHLQSDRDYIIHVTAANDYGESSVSVVMVTTSTSSFPLVAIYAMVILVAPVLLLVIVGCMAVAGCIKRSIEKAKPPRLICEVPALSIAKAPEPDSQTDENDLDTDGSGGVSVDSGLGGGSDEYTDWTSAGTNSGSHGSTSQATCTSGEVWLDLASISNKIPDGYNPQPSRDNSRLRVYDSGLGGTNNIVNDCDEDDETGYLRCASGYRDGGRNANSASGSYKGGYRYVSEGSVNRNIGPSACRDTDASVQRANDIASNTDTPETENGHNEDIGSTGARAKMYTDGYVSGYLYVSNNSEDEAESQLFIDDNVYDGPSDEGNVETKIYKNNDEVSDNESTLYEDGYRYELNTDDIDPD